MGRKKHFAYVEKNVEYTALKKKKKEERINNNSPWP